MPALSAKDMHSSVVGRPDRHHEYEEDCKFDRAEFKAYEMAVRETLLKLGPSTMPEHRRAMGEEFRREDHADALYILEAAGLARKIRDLPMEVWEASERRELVTMSYKDTLSIMPTEKDFALPIYLRM